MESNNDRLIELESRDLMLWKWPGGEEKIEKAKQSHVQTPHKSGRYERGKQMIKRWIEEGRIEK